MPRDCDATIASIDVKLDALSSEVNECKVLLSGNGHPERGVIVRLERVEQLLATQKKFTWAFLTVIVLPWAWKLLENYL